MALPTVSKTYQFNVNNIIQSENEVPWSQKLLHGIKSAMIGFATLPWTVVASSDSVTADASDNWATTTDLIWSSGNHAWIVLQQGAGGAQVCLDLNQAISTIERMNAFWSPSAGFTGGTISARPTATDEVDCLVGSSNQWSASQAGTPVQNVYHVMHSTDGLIDRIIICANGYAHTVWRFEPLKNPRTAHTNNPSFALISGNNLNELVYTDCASTSVCAPVTEKDGTGTAYSLLAATLAVSTILLGDVNYNLVPEEWDNELWPMEEHFVMNTVGSKGPKGSAIDSWFGQETILSSGDTMPDSEVARQFVSWGPYIWPWLGDGTIPRVA